MLALFSTAFILFGAPAILLYAGRLIQSATDPAQRAAAKQRTVLTGDEWFCRAPRPIFRQGAEVVNAPVAEPLLAQQAQGDHGWFFRPMRPLIAWPNLRRMFRRGGRATAA